MKDKPLVSLLMAAYNNVAYIKWAIESAQAQTHTNWELLIQDDGSTDGTLELAEVLAKKDKRIKVKSNGKNIGYNATMIEVANRATGEFYAHFDSDDLLERYAIEEVLRLYDVMPHLVHVYSDLVQIGRGNETESYSISPTFDINKIHQHGWRHFGMYRSSVMDVIQGYNENLITTNGCSDGDLFMQILEKYPNGIMRIPKVLYYYRNHGNNISGKNAKCETCHVNDKCNFIRVWSGSLNYDQRTLKPKIEIKNETEKTS
jgi:glycosyltransferase involved in cell wall biosynthesis